MILRSNISFACSLNLPLPNHVHHLVPAYCSPGCGVRKEPQTGLDLALDEAMILLNNVIHILTGSALAFAWQELFAHKVTDGTNVGGILVDIDYPWGGNMG